MEVETPRRGRPPMNREETIDVKDMSPRERAVTDRERAAARTRELLEGGLDTEGSSDYHDTFSIDRDIIPDGWSYEWKVYQIIGMDMSQHVIELARDGWEPVPRERHPNLMPVGSKDQNITRQGQMLMERPAEITNAFRTRMDKQSRDVVRNQEALINSNPQKHFDSTNQGSKLAKVNKSFEAVAIPD